MNKIFNSVVSLISTLLAFLFGDFDFLLKTIITLMFIDYITGICKSVVQKKVNSSIGAKGIVKKVGYLCVIAVSELLDELLNVDGGLRTLVITTFIFNEMLSILENSGAIGIKIPDILYKSLEKLKKNNEDNMVIQCIDLFNNNYFMEV